MTGYRDDREADRARIEALERQVRDLEDEKRRAQEAAREREAAGKRAARPKKRRSSRARTEGWRDLVEVFGVGGLVFFGVGVVTVALFTTAPRLPALAIVMAIVANMILPVTVPRLRDPRIPLFRTRTQWGDFEATYLSRRTYAIVTLITAAVWGFAIWWAIG